MCLACDIRISLVLIFAAAIFQMIMRSFSMGESAELKQFLGRIIILTILLSIVMLIINVIVNRVTKLQERLRT